MMRARSAPTAPERRFPIRICLAVPPDGFGKQLDLMHAWLDHNCGADGWGTAPAGLRGIVNDAVAFYFLDPALAAAFVSRWCLGYRVAASDGAFRLRDDQPTPRIPTPPHKTP